MPSPRRAGLPGLPAADLYEPPALRRAPGLVLVHGLAPLGKDDPRLAEAARALARAGFRVALPTIPGLTRLRPRPEDAEPVVAAIHALAADAPPSGVSLLGVSVGAGPALLAATDPRVAGRVGVVLSLGGYASTVELLRFFLTGAYGYRKTAGRGSPQPEAARLFLRQNLDLLERPEDRRRLDAWLREPSAGPPAALSPEGAAVVRLVENRDPGKVGGLVAALPPRLRELLEALSPERVVPRLSARLLLVHGRQDPAVPFTESLRLAEAARAHTPTRLVVVGMVQHVEPEEAGPALRATPAELWRLWAVTFDFLTPR